MHDEWLEFLRTLVIPGNTKIVVLSFDGIGDAPYHEGKTTLEAAHTPNLDTLATRSELGLADPVGPGITPGSGPGHLAIFGYHPLIHTVGRGVLSALGIDFPLDSGDIAARGNFCTIDKGSGNILDRRAGRISTEECERLVMKLQDTLSNQHDIEIIVKPEREHRFVIIFRGDNLDPRITDTDPQKEGVAPLQARALDPAAERFAQIVNHTVSYIQQTLADEPIANMVLLRGFDRRPNLPLFPELYQIRALGIAAYPMYRGLARLVGMDVISSEDRTPTEFAWVQKKWDQYDYFFVHVKKTDSYGEDGNFEGKVKVLSDTDHYIPMLTGLNPDVFVVTGDHSTPAVLKAHSWHPVPFLLYSRYSRCDTTATFTELNCARGILGRFPMRYAMSLMLAHARRLQKYGA